MVAYSNQDSYNAYKQQTAMTASPGELTLMLYDGCIKFLKLSRLYIEEKNLSKAHESSIKAQNILNELLSSLDMNYELSGQLAVLYQFMIGEAAASNTAKDAEKLQPIIELLTDLRNTWQQAVKLNRQQSMSTLPVQGSSFNV